MPQPALRLRRCPDRAGRRRLRAPGRRPAAPRADQARGRRKHVRGEKDLDRPGRSPIMDMSPFEQWESDIRGYCRAYPTVFSHASNARPGRRGRHQLHRLLRGRRRPQFRGHNDPKMKQAMIDFISSDGISRQPGHIHHDQARLRAEVPRRDSLPHAAWTTRCSSWGRPAPTPWRPLSSSLGSPPAGSTLWRSRTDCTE